jgi:hypothetical protein
VNKLIEELARTCKESQEIVTMLKVKNRIHLSELMHELAKTSKNFQTIPRKSKKKVENK